MADFHKIMYVGLQMVPSSDRPNARPDRVWNGPGDVVEGIPPLQAYELCKHTDEWRDVTKLEGAALVQAQKDARNESAERLRVLKNPKGLPNPVRTVEGASEDELQAELDRRRAARAPAKAQAEKGITPAAPAIPEKELPTTDQKGKGKKGAAKKPVEDGLAVHKTDANLTNLANEAVERILARISADPDLEKQLLTEDGLPTHAALQEELKFAITADEYKVALGI